MFFYRRYTAAILPIRRKTLYNQSINHFAIFFRSRNIPWQIVIGFCSDNCSAMKGWKNSVLSRVLESQHHVRHRICNGCNCHLRNLCCKAGFKMTHMQLMRCCVIYLCIFISNIVKCHKNFKNLILISKLYIQWWKSLMWPHLNFFCSAKRKEQYLEFLDFTDRIPLKILKHASTR